MKDQVKSSKAAELQKKRNVNSKDLFESRTNIVAKYLLFFHSLKLIFTIKRHLSEKIKNIQILSRTQLKQSQEIPGSTHKLKSQNLQNLRSKQFQLSKSRQPELEIKILPNLQPEDDCQYLREKMTFYLNQRLIKKSNSLTSQNSVSKQNSGHPENSLQITWFDLLYTVIQTKKTTIYLMILFAFVEIMAARFTIHIIIQYFFQSVLTQDFEESYMYAGIIGALSLVYTVFFSLEKYMILKISSAIRFGMTSLIIQKIVNLSQYSLKKAEIGKIMNLLSNDLNTVEDKILFIGKLVVVPIYFIAVFVLLIIRFKLAGLAGIGCFFLLAAIGLYLTTVNSKILTSINSHKDERIKLTTQIIQGIKFIKIYSWQVAFQKIISSVRQKQVHYEKLRSFCKAIQYAIGFSLGNIISFVIIITLYALDPENLSSSNIFTILQIIMRLRSQLISFSFGMTSIQEIIIILNRYAEVLNIKNQRMIELKLDGQIKQKNNSPQILQNPLKITNFIQSMQKNFVSDDSSKSDQISSSDHIESHFMTFENCSFGWSSQRMILTNINWDIKKNSYIGIAGKIGSGKSTLLHAILQEIPYFSGHLKTNGSIAYVQQQSVIFSMSVRDNIIFDSPFNQQSYDRALLDSCLLYDIEKLPLKDQTMVGQKGITLSGGQKARLTLARALYINADTLVFDDPFSAVDAKVGMQIFNNLLLNYRDRKTIILATHHVQYLESCDEIIILDDHTIKSKGKYQQLYQQLANNKFSISDPKQKKITPIASTRTEQFLAPKIHQQQRFQVTMSSYAKYLFFFKPNMVLLLLVLICFIAADVGYVYAYKFLANYEKHIKNTYGWFDNNNFEYWMVIGGLFLIYLVLNFVKIVFLYLCVLKSNNNMHNKMIEKLTRAPLKYFDYTPSGQMISKFSNDFGILQSSVNLHLLQACNGIILTVILLVSIFTVDPIYIIPTVISSVLIILLFNFTKKVIEKTHELDLMQKAPLFTNLQELISGIIQIKYYSHPSIQLKTFIEQLNNSQRANFTYCLFVRFLEYYIGLISSLSFFVVLFIGLTKVDSMEKAGEYSMVIVFMLQLIDFFSYFIKEVSNLQANMISFERSHSMTLLQQQKQLISLTDKQKNFIIDENGKKSKQLTQLWKTPSIELKNLKMRYADKLPLTLNNLDVLIKPKQKIGIVGRTGAGKSSIVQSLLRLTQPEQNTIYQINHQNAMMLGLHTLRKNISVIPQKSFFFTDTLRKNLDPFDSFTDEQIWQALRDSNLNQLVERLQSKLYTNISAIENTFSVGEQQVLSLSRVLLLNNPILILDEATSSCDSSTDDFIQLKIKEKFVDSTVITIAHRLTTIADYDKVAVIDKGKIVEFAHPHELIMKKGQFYEMVQSSGMNRDKILDTAKTTWEKMAKKN